MTAMTAMTAVAPAGLSEKDFASDQEVRWCPGCGDYAILKSLQKTLPSLGVEPHNIVFVSGIGCAARFPYYMATYGFHTIHGRAPAVATGLKVMNPDLDVWLVTGDGDGLSIGGNHMLHLLRRNVDMQVLLFNNEIYGLTKGQYSPTSPVGMRTPSSPLGSVDAPLRPCTFALGAGARFVARSGDTLLKHLPEVFRRAHANKGASFVEILQNCIIYNDGAFEAVTNKKTSVDNVLFAEHGKPLVFGRDRDRGLIVRSGGFGLSVAVIGKDGVAEDDILRHDETNAVLANALATLGPPDFPMVMGVLYSAPGETFDHAVHEQIAAAGTSARKDDPVDDILSLLHAGDTWQVG
jgi:2-oxoglutarate/2-oxoacid ferredoxin oxidoreductase subunit beta